MNIWAVWFFIGLGGYVSYQRWATFKWPKVLAGFTLVGLLLTGATEVTFRWQEHTYSKIASNLAGREAHVHCQRFTGALFNEFGPVGWVPYDENGATQDISLKWSVCHGLLKYKVGGKGAPSDEERVAVHVLTHEAMHVSGELDEAAAECKAVQRDVLTAQAFGASSRDAQSLARIYYGTTYKTLEPNYQSVECVADGAMDENLPYAPWGPRS